MDNQSGKQALKSGVWYTIANFILRGAVFLTTPIFTRILSKSDVGIFSNYSSWISILIIIFTLEIPASLNLARFDFKDKLDEYISSSLLLSTCFTISFFVIGFIFKDFFIHYIGVSDSAYYLIFLYILLFPALEMYQLKWRIQYKYKMSVLLSILSTVLSLVFSLLLTFLIDNKLNGRIYGFYLPVVVIDLVFYIYIFVRCPHINFRYWPYILKISFPLVWHLLATQLLQSSDRIMITNMCGEEYNAIYTVAGTCSIIPQVLWASMNNAWSPWAYEQMELREYDKLRKASKPYSLFFGLITFALLLIGPEILFLLGGDDYMIGLNLMPVLIISYVFQFMYSLFVNIEFYHRKQYIIALSTIIAAVVNIALNFIFIPIFGYEVAAYTTLVGYILMFLIHFCVVKFYLKANWYSNGFILLFLLFSLLLIPLFVLLYNFRIARYVFIAVLALLTIVLIVVNIKTIKACFKEKSLNPLKQLFRI